MYVAFRLIGRNRQLLTNQAVPERYVEAMRKRITAQPGVEELRAIEAIYLGPPKSSSRPRCGWTRGSTRQVLRTR